MKFYRSPAPVAALSFDLDDTLYDNVPVMERAESWLVDELVRLYALPPPGNEYAFWARAADAARAQTPYLVHDVTAARVAGVILGMRWLGRTFSGGEDEARALIGRFIEVRSRIAISPAVVALLKRLKARYPLAALSNGNSCHQHTALNGLFRYDLRPGGGLRSKPSADLFHALAARLKLEPAQILHIGDEPETDVLGAMGAGCQCAWLAGGIAGRLARGEDALRLLPTLRLDSLFEIEKLLLPVRDG